jgi:hypothetical protein
MAIDVQALIITYLAMTQGDWFNSCARFWVILARSTDHHRQKGEGRQVNHGWPQVFCSRMSKRR